MSFWKKLFGKNEQPLTEENIVVDDELIESEIETDSSSESDHALEEAAEEMEIEPSSTDEVVTDESVNETQERPESETKSSVEGAQVSEESDVDADVVAEGQDTTDPED